MSADRNRSLRTWFNGISNILAPLTSLIAVTIFLSIVEKDQKFLTPDNWKNICESIAVFAILAVGETAVIITGGIDLSVGRILALCAVVSSSAMAFHGATIGTAILISCGVGLACGLTNGALVAWGKMPPFIATLGMMGIANGLALLVSGGTNISQIASGFSKFSQGELFGSENVQGIPYPLIILMVVALIGHILLSRTSWGRKLYAVGGNKDAARLSGIKLNWTTITVYSFAGLLAGFAAVLHVSRTGGGQPTAGQNFELQAIAATVIGGTSLAGGSGNILGTMIGAFLMAVIQNGCDLKGIEQHYQLIIIGLVVWLASMYDGLRRKARG